MGSIGGRLGITVAGDGPPGDRLVHLLLLLLWEEVGCHFACFPATAATTAVAILEVQLLMVY